MISMNTILKLNIFFFIFLLVYIKDGLCNISNLSKFQDSSDFVSLRRYKRQAALRKSSIVNTVCTTSNGEQGYCRPTIYCKIGELQNNIWKLIDQLCILDKTSIGICCPSNYHSDSSARLIPEVITNINEDSINGVTRIVNRPENRGCGITTKQFPRITGGRPAEPDEWPWMAAIFRLRYPHVHCGGILVTSRHVLTAAHCVDRYTKEDIFIRLGEYDIEQYNETRSRDFRVDSIVYHIDFDPQTYLNDIAILRVNRATLFNTYIWPICMPPTGENWEGWNAIVTGWGTQFFGGPHSKILMEVTVPIWQQSECKKMFIERVEDTLLCAGATEGGRDSCQGDSGGPLLIQLPNKRWIVIGIVSWGVRCGEKNRPGLYTRVDRYLSWIIENAEQN